MAETGTSGKVYLVGAGPGAPDLLTLRAARLLADADIVLHDALVNPKVLALATHAQLIPVGKRCGAHSTAQRFINKRLVDAVRTHPVVVRLKGGDPMLFGRAQEEIDALNAAGIAFEVVPGVTAALAASAQLGISLTRRGVARTITFVTPRIGDDETGSDWIAAVMAADTVALYMGAGQAGAIAQTLIGHGMSPSMPVVVVRDASLPGSQMRPGELRNLAYLCATTEDATPGPAMILMGETLRDAMVAAEAENDAADVVAGSPSRRQRCA